MNILHQTKICLIGMIITLLFTNYLHAQTTVGIDEDPAPGSLLQVKNIPGNGLVNADKGIGMPRMQLTDPNNLYPMFWNSSANAPTTEYTSQKATIDETHKGLVVYNLKDNFCPTPVIGAGINVWMGSVWEPVLKPDFPAKTDVFVDKRDPANPETYRIGDFGEAGWWMLEYLRATTWAPKILTDNPSIAGITENSSNSTTVPYYYYPNGSAQVYTDHPEYGIFYNWAAATAIRSASATNEGNMPYSDTPEAGKQLKYQGICPDGWHLPSHLEFQKLAAAVDEVPCKYDTTEASAYTTGLKSPDGVNGVTSNGTSRPFEQSGFNAYLSGYISNGSPNFYGTYGFFWASSTSGLSSEAYAPYLLTSTTADFGFAFGRTGFAPVRCVRD